MDLRGIAPRGCVEIPMPISGTTQGEIHFPPISSVSGVKSRLSLPCAAARRVLPFRPPMAPAKPSFVVSASELDAGGKEYARVIPNAWLKSAFDESDATPLGEGEID